ncbi:MAG: amino acid adenylation domain-containing protein [Mycobacterium sp.]
MTISDSGRGSIEDVMALSPLQLGLYSLAALSADGTDPYTITMSAHITGALDVRLLRDCTEAMLVRHPNLRVSFFHGNLSRPVQVVPAHVELRWQQVTAQADEVEALESAERVRPFTLAAGPLIRFLLIEVPNSHWRMVVTAHHIVIDGWSLPLFIGELITLYRGHGDIGMLPPAPRPYRDYIGWLAARDPEAGRALWRQHLGGIDGPTLLSPALTTTEPQHGRPDHTEIRLGREATSTLAEAARACGVTVNTVIQMAWATVLSGMTDRGDVTFGVTVSGRPAELAGVEAMVGLFINTVPLRVRLDPAAPVGTQMLALQGEAAALRDHSYFGHSELRALADVGELFDTLLVYENFPPGGIVGAGEFTANGATFRPAAMESLSHFPVTIAAHLTDGDLTVFVEVLEGALGPMRPEDLGRRLLTTAQRLVTGWDRPLRDISILTASDTPPVCVPELPEPTGGVHTRFVEIVSRQPDSTALTWRDGAMTYRGLNTAADRVAAALTARGVRPETPVAITLPRGPEYVVAMFAVLKAGAVIVPLDPAMPGERIADILGQVAPAVVIDASTYGELADSAAEFMPPAVTPDQAAYVVFTSGTTGRPKGVIGTHRAVLAYAADHAQHVLAPAAARLGRSLRIAHAWSFTFDAAWQPLAALLDGHTVHIVGDESQRDAEALVEIINRFGLDMIDTTPSMFEQLKSFGLLTEVPLAVLALGGEAVGIPAWRQIRDECRRTGMTAFNCYGPTETTVEAVVAAIDQHPAPSIGGPTAATVVHVLDSWLRPVPDGVAGELYLSGDQLARGYLGRPGDTASRFVADPVLPGRRMYRTGDVVRRGPDGGLLFLGRSDDQVKIRGFRVEPGEIAAVLLQHPGVRHAHIVVRRHSSGHRLTAYVVAPDGSVPDLRSRLLARLPRYMVPQHIVRIDELPLTGNGKIDESALPAVDLGGSSSSEPETDTESALAALLAEVLETPRVDVTTEFLDMGLDSIAALSLVQAARGRGIELRARLMLECTNIRELAAAIDGGSGTLHPAVVDDNRFGEVVPAPVVSWMLEAGGFRRFTQNLLVALPAGLPADRLEQVLQALLDRHDMLRSVLQADGDGYRLVTRAPGAVKADEVLQHLGVPASEALADHAVAALDRIDPGAGRMVSAVSFAGPHPSLLLCVHHLATDVVSWYVILADLAQLATQLDTAETPALEAEYTTYREFGRLLAERSTTEEVASQQQYWLDVLTGPDPQLGSRPADPDRDTWASLRQHNVLTEVAETRSLLDKLDKAGIEVRDFLLAALTVTLTTWRATRGQPADGGTLVALEGHGREDPLIGGPHDNVDTSATVGWFTSVFPVRLGIDHRFDIEAVRGNPSRAHTLISSVSETVAAVPNRGLDYGLLRHQRREPALLAAPQPQVEFNYMGRLDLSAHGAGQPGAPWSLITDPALNQQLPTSSEPDLPLRYTFDIIAVVTPTDAGPHLLTSWRWSDQLSSEADIDQLSVLWQKAITTLGDAL